MKQGWEYKKLGEVCEIARGGSPRPISDYITEDPNGINWIKIGDAVDGDKYIRHTKERIKPDGVSKSRFVNKGDFILSNSMSFGKPYILDIEGCIHDGWLVLHDSKNLFIKDYLYYLLSSPLMYAQFKSLAVGGVVNNLNSKVVSNVTVAIPPLSTQQSIVSELDEINNLLSLKRKELETYDKLAQSLFYEMFGDPVENEKGWEVKKLGEVCEKITDGTHNSPTNESVGDYKYVTAKNIKKDGIILDNITYVDKDTHRSIYERCDPKQGDVLYIKDGVTTGIATINSLTEEFSLLSSVALLRPGNDINNQYLKGVLNMPEEYDSIRSNMGGAAITRLTIVKIKSLKLPLPPLPLQQLFATRIEAIEAQKANVKAAIEKLEALLAARMQYWFE